MTGRICILTETYHPEVGGGETQARALAEGLAARGHAVELLTRRSRPDSAKRERLDGVEIARLPPTGRGSLKKWALALPVALALLRRARRADAILVCGFRILGMPAVAVARLFGVRCVLKADSVGEMSGAFFERGLADRNLSRSAAPVRVLLAARDALLRRADAFVAISRVIEAELEAGGVPPERVVPIPNGVDTERLRPAEPAERRALRERLRLPTEARIAVYTGRLVRYKGLFELVEAWAALCRTRGDLKLLLVGSGGLDVDACESELRERVARLGLSAQVHFTGAVPDVRDLLRAADVFVFPSQDEAFGLSLVEAMACGLPAVSTTVGGLADVVRDGKNAVAVAERAAAALEDALGHLLDDAPRRARLGRAAREDAVARFGMDAVVDDYQRLLLPAEEPA